MTSPAVSAEPRGTGTSSARDPLAREVKLLGALLGQVITEQAGIEVLDLVERVRRTAIALRRGHASDAGHRQQREALERDLDDLEPDVAEGLIRAFTLYFQLANLAEEKQRVRRLRQRARSAARGSPDDSLGAAIERLRAFDAFYEFTHRRIVDLVDGVPSVQETVRQTAHRARSGRHRRHGLPAGRRRGGGGQGRSGRDDRDELLEPSVARPLERGLHSGRQVGVGGEAQLGPCAPDVEPAALQLAGARRRERRREVVRSQAGSGSQGSRPQRTYVSAFG